MCVCVCVCVCVEGGWVVSLIQFDVGVTSEAFTAGVGHASHGGSAG